MLSAITQSYTTLKEWLRRSGFVGFESTVRESSLRKRYHLFQTPGRNSNSNLPAYLQDTNDNAMDRDTYLEKHRPYLENIIAIQNSTERCCYHKIQNMIIARGGRPTTLEEKQWIEDVVKDNEWKFISTKEWQEKIVHKFGIDYALTAGNAFGIATRVFGQENLQGQTTLEEKQWIGDVVKDNEWKFISHKEWQEKIVDKFGIDCALTAGNAFRVATRVFGQENPRRRMTLEEKQWIGDVVKDNECEYISQKEWQEKIVDKFGIDCALPAGNAYRMATSVFGQIGYTCNTKKRTYFTGSTSINNHTMKEMNVTVPPGPLGLNISSDALSRVVFVKEKKGEQTKLLARDIILSVDHVPVKTADECANALLKQKDEYRTLLIKRKVLEDSSSNSESAQQVEGHVKRHVKRRRRWTPEEDDILRNAVSCYDRQWTKIATHLPGRDKSQCKQRYQRIASLPPTGPCGACQKEGASS